MGRLDEVARTLYALPPADFIPGATPPPRTSPTPRPRATIRGFRKPSAAASAVNAFVRAEPDAVDELLAVGAGLRAAQEGLDRDAVRDFARRRQQVIASAEKRLAIVVAGPQREHAARGRGDPAGSDDRPGGRSRTAERIPGARPRVERPRTGRPVGGRRAPGRRRTVRRASTPRARIRASAKRPKPAQPRRIRDRPAHPTRHHANPPPNARRGSAGTPPPSSAPSAPSPSSPMSPSRCRRWARTGRGLEAERDRLSRELASAESALAASREAERELRRRRKVARARRPRRPPGPRIRVLTRPAQEKTGDHRTSRPPFPVLVARTPGGSHSREARVASHIVTPDPGDVGVQPT